MKVLRVDHSYNFHAKDVNTEFKAQLTSPPKLSPAKDGIPKSTWQLSCEKENTSWRLRIHLKNFVDFKNAEIIAVGSVVLKLHQPGQEESGCYHFNLYPFQLRGCNHEIIWSFANENVKYDKKYSFSVSITLISSLQDPNMSKLQNDFGSLLENGLYTDIVLSVGENQLKVHKNILCSRSSVFQKMFELENCETTVKIDDVRSEILQEMLKFMYTGTFKDDGTNNDGFLEELYTAAAKFDVTDLKKTVSEKLWEGICIQNVLKRLVLADQFGEMALRKLCFEFMRDNCDSLAKNASSLS